tara:strand:- start:4 stop:210 length:207 start_codon:yes stop_codon:yes gene_type:complete
MSSYHDDYLEMKYEEQLEEYEILIEEKRETSPYASDEELESMVKEDHENEESNSWHGHPSLTVEERNS